jgi:hypothetical protein
MEFDHLLAYIFAIPFLFLSPLLPPCLSLSLLGLGSSLRSSMTFSVLRALYGIIGEALDEMEAIYALHGSQNKSSAGKENYPNLSGRPPSGRSDRPHHHPALSINSSSNAYLSPPPSPCVKTDAFHESSTPDFPSLDAHCDPSSLSETLTQHPDVIAAINRIIAACGQMTATVQTPFLTICDATMSVSFADPCHILVPPFFC